MKEVWRDVKGYEGTYQVSNYGKVRSLDRTVYYEQLGVPKSRFFKGKELRLQKDRAGYIYTHLSLKGNGKNVKVHRLVCEAFCRKRPGANNVNHKDGDKTNNVAGNLEWTTSKENTKHAFGSGLQKGIGQYSKDNVLTEEDVIDIRDNHHESYDKLASKYNVSKSTIADIKKYRSWKWLGGDELIDTSTIDKEKFPKQIRKIRKEKGLTIEKFANSLGVTRSTVMRWEKGTIFPKDVFLRKIIEIYDFKI